MTITTKNSGTNETEMTARVISAALEASKFHNKDRDSQQCLHLELEPVDKNIQHQHLYVNMASLDGSVMLELARQLNTLKLVPDMDGPNSEQLSIAIITATNGKIFKWVRKKIGSKSSKLNWFPTELVG